MKYNSHVLLITMLAAFSWTGQAPAAVSGEKPVVVEGQIVSIDVAGKSLVIKAKIEKEDTFDVTSAAIVKAEKSNQTITDLAPESPVRVHYTVNRGRMVAAQITTQPLWREAPPPIIQGDEVIMAEGVIKSIDNKGGTMIIRAALEQQDTFAVDSNADIKADNRLSTLDEIRNFAGVRLHYIIQQGKKVARRIVGTNRKHGDEAIGK